MNVGDVKKQKGSPGNRSICVTKKIQGMRGGRQEKEKFKDRRLHKQK